MIIQHQNPYFDKLVELNWSRTINIWRKEYSLEGARRKLDTIDYTTTKPLNTLSGQVLPAIPGNQLPHSCPYRRNQTQSKYYAEVEGWIVPTFHFHTSSNSSLNSSKPSWPLHLKQNIENILSLLIMFGQKNIHCYPSLILFSLFWWYSYNSCSLYSDFPWT